jgi:hypothetical protein
VVISPIFRWDYEDSDWNCSSNGRDYISEFKKNSTRNKYVETRNELLDLKIEDTDRLLAIFSQRSSLISMIFLKIF